VIRLLAVCESYALADAVEEDQTPGPDLIVMRGRPTLLRDCRIVNYSVYFAIVVGHVVAMDVRRPEPKQTTTVVVVLVDPDLVEQLGLADDGENVDTLVDMCCPQPWLTAAFVADWMPGYVDEAALFLPRAGWATNADEPAERGLLDVGEITEWSAEEGMVRAHVSDTVGEPPFLCGLRCGCVAPGRTGPWRVEHVRGAGAPQFTLDTSGIPLGLD
jgi:hypothetical protein